MNSIQYLFFIAWIILIAANTTHIAQELAKEGRSHIDYVKTLRQRCGIGLREAQDFWLKYGV